MDSRTWRAWVLPALAGYCSIQGLYGKHAKFAAIEPMVSRYTLPLYAQYGVAHVWLVDPAKRTLEVYALLDGAWPLQLQAGGADVVQAPPFVELNLELESLWV
jgi:hypothetical protein